jgi:hypothetical protein
MRKPRRARSVAGQTANELTRAILQYLEMIGVVAWRNNTGAFRGNYETIDGAIHQRFFKFGARGSGDILAIVPPRGQFVSIEVKVGRDVLRASQDEWIERIEKVGGVGVVAHSLQDVIDAMDDLGVPFQKRARKVMVDIGNQAFVLNSSDVHQVAIESYAR